MWVLILPHSVQCVRVCWSFCSVYEQTYWPNLWPWLSLSFTLSHSLSLFTCWVIVCLHGWRNRRTQTELNALCINEKHYQALFAHHSHWIWLCACVCVCMCLYVCAYSQLTRGSNKSTCLSTASFLPLPPLLFLFLPTPLIFFSPTLPPPTLCPSLSFMFCNSFLKAQGAVSLVLLASW